jgi:glycosyltransferase involved in cell wall biosynthesis
LFHFNPFAGAPSDYPRQAVRRRHFADAFRAIAAALPVQPLHFYATTDELTEQFNRIRSGAVVTLGYPIDPDFARSKEPRRDGQPLRIVFAGDARLEKGYQHLPAIVAALRPMLDARQVQFVLQSNFPFSIPCRRRNLPLVAARHRLSGYPPDQVSLLNKPLDPAAYQQLIAQADIGVLPYDPVHYHARCSGVLLEMLTAGVPLVVGAGGWMAHQVAGNGAGVVARNLADFPRALHEVVTHYGRYKKAAQEASADLLRRRHPRRFMADLLSHSAALSRRPQAA